MHSMLSKELLAVCLLLDEGDTGKSIEEIIALAEKYQLENNRHFGITQDDFRSSFYELGYNHKVVTYGDIYNGTAPKILAEIPLKSWISNILEYEDVYFNDEGCSRYKNETWDVSGRNQLMRDFFICRVNPSSNQITDFLRKKSSAVHCSNIVPDREVIAKVSR